MPITSIYPIDRAQSGTTIPGQSGPGSNSKFFRILQSLSITGTSPSGHLVSYPRNSLAVGSYPSAEEQSVYSTAPVDWAIHNVNVKTVLFLIIQFSISTQFRCQNSSI